MGFFVFLKKCSKRYPALSWHGATQIQQTFLFPGMEQHKSNKPFCHPPLSALWLVIASLLAMVTSPGVDNPSNPLVTYGTCKHLDPILDPLFL